MRLAKLISDKLYTVSGISLTSGDVSTEVYKDTKYSHPYGEFCSCDECDDTSKSLLPNTDESIIAWVEKGDSNSDRSSDLNMRNVNYSIHVWINGLKIDSCIDDIYHNIMSVVPENASANGIFDATLISDSFRKSDPYKGYNINPQVKYLTNEKTGFVINLNYQIIYSQCRPKTQIKEEC